MELFVVRHGQTNYNLKNLCNDDPSIKVTLTEKGKEQAAEVKIELENTTFDAVYISNIPRTRETAELIVPSVNKEFMVEKRLNDRKTGFEGKTTFEFNEIMKEDLFHNKLLGGESFQEEKARVFAFLEELKEKSYGNVLIVSHHEIIKIITGYFNYLTDQEMWDLIISNCSVNRFTI
jgi:alpha-ribazole phosphatase